jgi:hypothetical protein
MSNDQLLAIVSMSVLASGHFPCPTDEWEARPCANKTWTNWKKHYKAAHLACKHQLLTAGKATPTMGAANTVTTANDSTTADDIISSETLAWLDGYLDNLAAAAMNERTTLMQLIKNNASLTASVTSLTASVRALTAVYNILLASGNTNATNALPGQNQQPRSGTGRNKTHEIGVFCWTYGYRLKKGHNSTMCTRKVEGHKDTATRANTMNGSIANKGWDT